MTIKNFLTGCCSAKVETRGEHYKRDFCTKCGNAVHYALVDKRWIAWEGVCGVLRDYAGKWWFFWMQCSTLDEVEHSDMEYVAHSSNGYGAEVDTVSRRMDRDLDLISDCVKRSFLNEWLPKVENPEVAEWFKGS